MRGEREGAVNESRGRKRSERVDRESENEHENNLARRERLTRVGCRWRKERTLSSNARMCVVKLQP